jgi:hypothetical protein
MNTYIYIYLLQTRVPCDFDPNDYIQNTDLRKILPLNILIAD